MFAQYLDRLPHDRLVEIALRVDRVAPEGQRGQPQTRDREIGETAERPTQHFQHLIYPYYNQQN